MFCCHPVLSHHRPVLHFCCPVLPHFLSRKRQDQILIIRNMFVTSFCLFLAITQLHHHHHHHHHHHCDYLLHRYACEPMQYSGQTSYVARASMALSLTAVNILHLRKVGQSNKISQSRTPPQSLGHILSRSIDPLIMFSGDLLSLREEDTSDHVYWPHITRTSQECVSVCLFSPGSQYCILLSMTMFQCSNVQVSTSTCHMFWILLICVTCHRKFLGAVRPFFRWIWWV